MLRNEAKSVPEIPVRNIAESHYLSVAVAHRRDRNLVVGRSRNRRPFTCIDIRLNRDGYGEGKMSLATKVIYDKKDNMISLENFQTSPVLITNVKRTAVNVE